MYVAFLSVKYVPLLPFTYIPFCNLSSYVSFVLFNVPFRDRVVGRGMGVVVQGLLRGHREVPIRGWGWPRVAEASVGLSPLHAGAQSVTLCTCYSTVRSGVCMGLQVWRSLIYGARL